MTHTRRQEQTHPHRNSFADRMSVAALFMTAPQWEQPRYLSADGWLRRRLSPCNGILSGDEKEWCSNTYCPTWVSLEHIMVNKNARHEKPYIVLVPLWWRGQNRGICTESQWISGGRGLGRGVTANDHAVSCGGESALRLVTAAQPCEYTAL